MAMMFMNMENSKTNETHKCVPDLSQKLDLRSSKNLLLFKTYLFITREKI